MIEINPKLLSKYNCFQANVMLASEYFNRPTHFLFSSSLNFIYHPKQICIGDKLTQYYKNPVNEMPVESLEFMSLYDGISLVPHRLQTWDTFLNCFFAEEKRGYPLILSLCDLNRPWTEISQNLDLSKFILVIQINNGYIYYLDPFKTDRLHMIRISLIKGNLECVNFWSFTLNTNTEKIDIDKVILFHKEFFKKNYYVNNLECFAKDLQNLFDYDLEIGRYKEINDVPIMINLRQVFVNRMSFLEYLAFIKSILPKEYGFYEVCNKVNEDIKRACVLWDNLILQLIRKKMRNKKGLINAKIAETILSIYTIEKEAIDSIINYN